MSKVLNCDNGNIATKRVENETPLTAKADEAGRIVSTPVHTASQASKVAKGKVKSSGMKSGIEAQAVTIGLPYLKARETVSIENIGKKFSGNWRITKITHEISSSGYTCNLTLNKDDYSTGNGKKKSGSAPKGSVSMNKNNAKAVNEVKAGEGNTSGNTQVKKPATYILNVDKGEYTKNG